MQRRASKKYVLVVDTSVLISLHELGCVELLENLSSLPFVDVVLPDTVMNELARARTRVHLSQGCIRTERAVVNALPDDIPRRLGRGERGVIAVAYELTQRSGAIVVAVTDDGQARAKCERIGVKVHGTLGLIELAKKWGIVTKEEALRILDQVPGTKLHITVDVLTIAKEKIQSQ
ncbi:MAG: hypothetical protein QW324_08450 [Thermofilaceae archaeon]